MPKTAHKRDWKDQYTLLCEKCGYVLEGLDTTNPCPECGKPIEESLPQRRPGTPWQQNPSTLNMIKTWRMTLVHPLRTFDQMRFHQADGIDQASWSLLTMLVLSIFAAALPILFVNPVLFVAVLILSAPFAAIIMLICFFLTWLESLALRTITRQMDVRFDRTAIWIILGHAAVGWMIMVLFFVLGLWTIAFIPEYLITNHTQTPSGNMAFRNPFTMLVHITSKNLPLFGLIVGPLTLQAITYLGLRRCKYANRIRPTESLPNEPRP